MASELLNRVELGISQGLKAVEVNEKIVTHSKENLNTIKELEQNKESIDSIVATIKDIASQTHLLALNATIEAAHAGDNGKGFDIIATEVRILSNQVKNSISEIDNNVRTMGTVVQNISQAIIQSQQGILESQMMIEKTMSEFENIGTSACQLDSQAKEFKDLT